MKQNDVYQHWIRARRAIDVDTNFTDRVMQKIEREPHHYRQSLLPGAHWVKRLRIAAWARVAALILASVLGLGRILLTLHLLLSV